jgi:16S rRNA (guanine1207-N2)-methyltransferase
VDEVALATRPRVVVFLEMGTRKSRRPDPVELGLAVLPRNVPIELEFITIWSNPPTRVGKAELHALLKTWMPRPAIGSDARSVVARNLGAGTLQQWMDVELSGTLTVIREELKNGFRILNARRRKLARSSCAPTY